MKHNRTKVSMLFANEVLTYEDETNEVESTPD